MKVSKLTKVGLPLVAVVATGVIGVGLASASSHAASRLTPAQRVARYEQRLDRAVTAGKLTSAQEQALLAEHATLAAQLQSAPKPVTRQERQTIKQEATSWAQQNNLSVKWLEVGRSGRRHLGKALK